MNKSAGASKESENGYRRCPMDADSLKTSPLAFPWKTCLFIGTNFLAVSLSSHLVHTPEVTIDSQQEEVICPEEGLFEEENSGDNFPPLSSLVHNHEVIGNISWLLECQVRDHLSGTLPWGK
mmetsp:Transcript_6571/g.13786  ORF Transcript_6571/g.13786 Transcript_6571/m.13786 type:complete len:122 (-) Transcript_6571:193-558(-)